jgi:hypothetical protein
VRAIAFNVYRIPGAIAVTDSLFNTGFYMPTPVGFVNASIGENANATGNATAFAHWFQQPMQDGKQ